MKYRAIVLRPVKGSQLMEPIRGEVSCPGEPQEVFHARLKETFPTCRAVRFDLRNVGKERLLAACWQTALKNGMSTMQACELFGFPVSFVERWRNQISRCFHHCFRLPGDLEY